MSFSVGAFNLFTFKVVINMYGFLHSAVGEESACNAGDLGSIPELGRSLGEGKGYPLQYSGLENSMAYTVAKSRTRLSDFHFLKQTVRK